MLTFFNMNGLAQAGAAIVLGALGYFFFGPWGSLAGAAAAGLVEIGWRWKMGGEGGRVLFVPVWLSAMMVSGIFITLDRGGPPDTVEIDGASFKKSRSGKIAVGTIRATQYFRNTLPGVQVGVLADEKKIFDGPEEMHRWVLEEYRKQTPTQWYTDAGARAACKVGRMGARSFLAVDLCGQRGEQVVCVEYDERVDIPCGPADAECVRRWAAAQCEAASASRRPGLESLIDQVAR